MREAAIFIAGQHRVSSGPLAALAAAFGRLHHRLRNRRQVLLLTELDDHVLSDIGVTRSDVRSALSQPFSADPSLELERIALSNRSRWQRI
jgi:uncharacterized protein YjiS (DUF1127 family)